MPPRIPPSSPAIPVAAKTGSTVVKGRTFDKQRIPLKLNAAREFRAERAPAFPAAVGGQPSPPPPPPRSQRRLPPGRGRLQALSTAQRRSPGCPEHNTPPEVAGRAPSPHTEEEPSDVRPSLPSACRGGARPPAQRAPPLAA